MAETIENRVANLERRVSEWEGQMGFLIPLTKQLHRDVIAVNEKVDRLEIKVDRLDVRVSNLEVKVDRGFAATLEQFKVIGGQFQSLEAKVDALPRALAEIITKK